MPRTVRTPPTTVHTRLMGYSSLMPAARRADCRRELGVRGDNEVALEERARCLDALDEWLDAHELPGQHDIRQPAGARRRHAHHDDHLRDHVYQRPRLIFG